MSPTQGYTQQYCRWFYCLAKWKSWWKILEAWASFKCSVRWQDNVNGGERSPSLEIALAVVNHQLTRNTCCFIEKKLHHTTSKYSFNHQKPCTYPLVNQCTCSYEKPPSYSWVHQLFLWAIFNSKLWWPEGSQKKYDHWAIFNRFFCMCS